MSTPPLANAGLPSLWVVSIMPDEWTRRVSTCWSITRSASCHHPGGVGCRCCTNDPAGLQVQLEPSRGQGILSRNVTEWLGFYKRQLSGLEYLCLTNHISSFYLKYGCTCALHYTIDVPFCLLTVRWCSVSFCWFVCCFLLIVPRIVYIYAYVSNGSSSYSVDVSLQHANS